MLNQLKYELYNVLSGKSQVRFGTTIQTIAGYLSNGTPPGSTVENTKHFKEQEEQRLENIYNQITHI